MRVQPCNPPYTYCDAASRLYINKSAIAANAALRTRKFFLYKFTRAASSRARVTFHFLFRARVGGDAGATAAAAANFSVFICAVTTKKLRKYFLGVTNARSQIYLRFMTAENCEKYFLNLL